MDDTKLAIVRIKLPRGVVAAAKSQAAKEDRSMASYLRRLITAAVEAADKKKGPNTMFGSVS